MKMFCNNEFVILHSQLAEKNFLAMCSILLQIDMLQDMCKNFEYEKRK